MNPLIAQNETLPLGIRRTLASIAIAFAWFALPQSALSVDPAPDGGYPNGNTAEGESALFSLTTGSDNTANGFNALYYNTTGFANTATGSLALYFNTTGSDNTANGFNALYYNTTGFANTATGSLALYFNTTGNHNTANGFNALEYNTTGFYNIATGAFALFRNTTGSNNIATGAVALFSNTTGSDNTANGSGALNSNTIGYYNTANGSGALSSNTTGNYNTANGYAALSSNSTGSTNTASGTNALRDNTTGIRNTANGQLALAQNKNGTSNTAEGFGALLHNTGSFNTAVGFNAGSNLTTGHDNINIGNPGFAGESNTMRLGNGKQTATFITGIRGVTTTNANAVPVVIDSAGQLGTVSSSARFKDHVAPMGETSEAVLGLKPVTFHYKSDSKGTPQFGLIAEEVAKINPDLVARDENGQIYTVRYEAVNAMLLNEFLKEHQKVEEQQSTIGELKTAMAQQQKQINALTARLQKVAARVEAGKSAPRVVSD